MLVNVFFKKSGKYFFSFLIPLLFSLVFWSYTIQRNGSAVNCLSTSCQYVASATKMWADVIIIIDVIVNENDWFHAWPPYTFISIIDIHLYSFISIRVKSKFLVGAYTSPYHLTFASENASGAPMLSISLLSDS